MFSLHFIESVLSVSPIGYGTSDCLNFSINSRTVQEGDCFLGLIGEHCDGGDFFYDAILKGAVGLILHQKHKENFLKIQKTFLGIWAFFVDDPKQALHEIAKAWRKKFTIPFIAITGSIGKTTTKELIRSILEKQGHVVCATRSSENGSIGLPLTILQLRVNHTIGVFEVGIEKIGEMDVLISLLDSVTVSVITTIVGSHLSYFKSLENVIAEKVKLQLITKNVFFIDALFKKSITKVPLVSFSDIDNGDVFYHSYSTKIVIDVDDKKYTINTLYHAGFHHCIVAAFLVGYYFKVKPSLITSVIESFKKIDGRFSVHHLKSGGIIINDAYNAVNPVVVLKSIESFEAFPTYKKKIIVLGDMFDLGDLHERAHEMIAEKICVEGVHSVEKFFCFGEALSKACKKYPHENIFLAASFDEMKDTVFEYLAQGYCVLFKASNGTKLFAHVVSYLKDQEV